MAVTEKAIPYVDRLIEDRQLQRDLREAASALRGGLRRAESKRRKPRRLLEDRKLKQNARRAASSLRDATARFRGEPPKSHRGRKILVIVAVIGAGAFAVREMLKNEPSATVVS